jgi:hypothetical protein
MHEALCSILSTEKEKMMTKIKKKLQVPRLPVFEISLP